MDGPIRSFVDTLARQQPLRNAARGLLGLPRRSAVIDPMEEMAARDREMGGDVSNPYPQQKRMPVRQASASEELPAPARQGVETIPTPPPIDEKQPYKGQSVFTAMFRTPQDGLDAQRKTAGGAATSSPMTGGTGLGQRMAEINGSDLAAPDKLDALATLMASAAADATARGDKDAMQTLVRVSEGFAQRAHAMRTQAAQAALMERGIKYQETAPERQATLYAEKTKEAMDYGFGLQERQYKMEQEGAQNAGNTARQFANLVSPLQEDPSLSVSEYAANLVDSARQARAATKLPMSQDEAQQMYDNIYRSGTRVRIGQYIASMVNDDGPAFDDTHPGFMELQAHYGRKLAEDDGQYDALYSDLMQAISPAVRAAAPGLPPEEQAAYIRQIIEGDGENRGLLGPKVESGWSLF